MCARQFDIRQDEHLSTVLVGVGDSASGEVLLANAGHLDPLVVSGPSSEFLLTKRGLPLGLGPNSYEPTTTRLEPGSTFIAFTDGLVERRGEIIDAGLERLASVARTAGPTVDDCLSEIVSQLSNDENRDDIAMLAFRWMGSTAR